MMKNMINNTKVTVTDKLHIESLDIVMKFQTHRRQLFLFINLTKRTHMK